MEKTFSYEEIKELRRLVGKELNKELSEEEYYKMQDLYDKILDIQEKIEESEKE